MSKKDELLRMLHKVYRNDELVNEILNAIGVELDNVIAEIDDLGKQYWFDEMTEIGIEFLENELSFKTDSSAPIADRRSQLQAKYKADGVCNLNLIQQVCNSWKNGDISPSFENGLIKLTFVGEFGIPTDLDGLYAAIDEVKPAHLAVTYTFKYLLIKDVQPMTLTQLEGQKLEEFAF